MQSLQSFGGNLGQWGNQLLGQAQTQLGPSVMHAADHVQSAVRKGASAVRTSFRDNFGGFVGSSHTFEDPHGGPELSVQELALIAEGAFGAVLRVRDSKSGKEYALKKILCQEGVQVASTREAAEREARILIDVPPHPNIIQCFGVGVENGSGGACLVKILLELCGEGHLLGYMDSRNGHLSGSELLAPFSQISDAVRHLHAQTPPIQHRDLKIENILQDGSGQWKLCDFGSCSTERVPPKELSRERMYNLQEDIDKTVTMLYRPPEMADIGLNYRKGYEINEKVDLWMLGCVLYTLAFYRHPFQDNVTVMAISNAKYFIPQDHPKARSSKLCGLIHWLLAANPGDRPAAAQLCELIHNISKCSYENLLKLLPPAVREKMQRQQALFSARPDSDLPVDGPVVRTGSGLAAAEPVAAPATRERPAALRPQDRQAATPRQQPPQAAEPAASNALGDMFDMTFALAPSPVQACDPVAGTVAAGGPVAARAAVTAVAPAPPQNLLELGPVAPVSGTSAAQLDDLLGFNTTPAYSNGVGAMAAAPVALGDALSVPAPATAPSPPSANAGGTDIGADWCDFVNFAAAPSPVPVNSSPSPGSQRAGPSDASLGTAASLPATAGGTVTGADWCDFVSFGAAPSPAPANPSPSVGSQRAGPSGAGVRVAAGGGSGGAGAELGSFWSEFGDLTPMAPTPVAAPRPATGCGSAARAEVNLLDLT